MPTDKEKIMIYIDKTTKDKSQIISKEDGRSMSNYITRLIEKDILKYELEYGKIKY